jgi:ATP-dependent helicase HrpA
LPKPLPSFFALKKAHLLLPVTKQREEFEAAIRKVDFVVVSSGTGSGKSTQIPQFIAHLGIGGGIAVTQPRVAAAMLVAERVEAEANRELGAEVGYQVRGSEKLPGNPRLRYVHTRGVGDPNQFSYVNDGLLLAEASHDWRFSEYHTIIIDEAHEQFQHTFFSLP